MIVAIDGPAGAGKSSVARALADRLGYTLLDSGAMYRCVALATLEAADPGASAARIAAGLEISLGERVCCDGVDVTDRIRTPEVSERASAVSSDPAVREILVAHQRRLLASGNWVAEGRDIGTVVAPNAEVKVFLTADPAERARRRAAELGVDPAAVLADQIERDRRDTERAHSPLKPAPDAVQLDTTGLSLTTVVEQIAILVLKP